MKDDLEAGYSKIVAYMTNWNQSSHYEIIWIMTTTTKKINILIDSAPKIDMCWWAVRVFCTSTHLIWADKANQDQDKDSMARSASYWFPIKTGILLGGQVVLKPERRIAQACRHRYLHRLRYSHRNTTKWVSQQLSPEHALNHITAESILTRPAAAYSSALFPMFSIYLTLNGR